MSEPKGELTFIPPGGIDTFVARSEYTAADVLAKLKTVDGSGSLVDADLLDGRHLADLSRVSSEGLSAYWSMDDVPEIPDAPSPDTTYLQDAWADVDGWTLVRCTASFSGEKMIITATDANPYIYRTVIASKTVKAKIKNVSGTFTATRIANSTGTVYTNDKNLGVGAEHIHDFYIGAGATGSLTIYVIGGAAGSVAEIDFIYIGTGAYLPNSLVDNSGNGNHGTIQGATPVPGISGKALAFDGVNDYAIKNPFSMSGSVFSLSLWYYNRDNIFGIFAGLGVFGDSGIRMWSNPGYSMTIRLAGPTLDEEIVTAAPAPLNAWSHFYIAVDCVTKHYDFYYNGALYKTGTSTGTPIMPSIFTLGAEGSSGSSNDNCIIDEPRIYNRALSAEEVKYLYDNPGVPIPADATVIYYEDDAVLSTATASLEFTERYSGL